MVTVVEVVVVVGNGTEEDEIPELDAEELNELEAEVVVVLVVVVVVLVVTS